jgi:glycerol-3-phosphate dehydrogenase (NAD(P)+)
MSEVATEAMPGRPVVIVSGPTFADELARGSPSAVTIASTDASAAAFVAEALRSRTFKPYTSSDVVGAQIGGSVKNVLAIAAGIATGLDLGENARAALITRGLAEMARLGLAKGARAETLMGLSGVGDLMLTCNSTKSRNTSLGIELAKGRPLDAILGERRSVAEGVFSAEAVVALASRHGVEMPITAAVHAVLSRGVTPAEAIEDLLSRPLKPEWW